jgi:haloalkane dehalogenase
MLHHPRFGEIVRTLDDRFDHLPGYDFAPRWIEDLAGYEGLRAHYLDEGPRDGGRVFLCLHGEPSWSYLYRKMIPLLVDAGFRCLAPDLIGFGKSDKPDDQAFYTYARHVSWLSQWREAVVPEVAGLFCQDWGGLIGLRLVAAFPDRFARLVIANLQDAAARGALVLPRTRVSRAEFANDVWTLDLSDGTSLSLSLFSLFGGTRVAATE